MRRLAIVFALTLAGSSFAQDRTECWLSAGVKHKINSDFTVGLGTNARFRWDGKVETLFQDVSLKYTHFKWVRPSLEYRLITDYDIVGNYTLANRLNMNLDFKKGIEKFDLGLRFRYQTNLGGSSNSSGGDLDPSLRIKPSVSYKLKGRVQPSLSAEFFYNPVNEALGKRFNRARYGLTAEIDLPGPNELSVTYYYGRKFNTGKPYQEHLLSLEYGFEWRGKKK